jgi:hypothetical protein
MNKHEPSVNSEKRQNHQTARECPIGSVNFPPAWILVKISVWYVQGADWVLGISDPDPCEAFQAGLTVLLSVYASI